VPKANRPYWEQKVARNRERDLDSLEKLRTLGWQVLTLWECEIRSIKLASLKRFLDDEIG